jgi:hypothetical protein
MQTDASRADIDDVTAMLLRLEKRVAALEHNDAGPETIDKERDKVILLERGPGAGAG